MCLSQQAICNNRYPSIRKLRYEHVRHRAASTHDAAQRKSKRGQNRIYKGNVIFSKRAVNLNKQSSVHLYEHNASLLTRVLECINRLGPVHKTYFIQHQTHAHIFIPFLPKNQLIIVRYLV
ncbi:hypothetical protein QTP88_025818 [Uroleucon formosanum]